MRPTNRLKSRPIFTMLGLFLPLFCGGAVAADWPTYLHDSLRSGVAGEPLPLPLRPAWVYRAKIAPRPAWPNPAPNDYWHHKHGLRPRQVYDRAFHVVAAGGSVFFGSSGDDHVRCLDAATGKVRWSFATEGPVRFAPTIVADRVLAASDDGCVYCLSADDGRLLWTYRSMPQRRAVIGNGRIISRWPIRTGVAVKGGVGYCCAGFFPLNPGVYLSALDVKTGREIYKRKIDLSAQGYILCSDERLYVPTGRTAPGVFDRASGLPLGGGKGLSPGGGYAVIAGGVLAAGPGDASAGSLTLSDARTHERVVTFPGLHFLADGGRAYLHSPTELAALDWEKYRSLPGKSATPEQKESCRLWRKPCDQPYSLILAGDVLLAGGADRVTAYQVSDGKPVWSAAVAGRAYGLAVAGGRLLVSTSDGVIYGFEHDPHRSSRTGNAEADKPETVEKHDPFALPSPYPNDDRSGLYRQAAESILSAAGAKQGFCLVLDASTGRLAYEIAKRSRLRVLCVEEDPAKIATARRLLTAAGLYGSRIVFHRGTLDRLGLPPYFANLIVSDTATLGAAPAQPPEALFRLLRPCGGVICLGRPADHATATAFQAKLKDWLDAGKWPGAEAKLLDKAGVWAVVRRGRLSGAGQWTHSLADPGNTACSMDRRVVAPLELQWFGRPGPRRMADRHHRNVTPLYKDGRLFVPGVNVVFAVDAYNGTMLWQRETPDSLRLGAFLDCSNMAVDAGHLYVVARDRCRLLDAATGKTDRTITMPQAAADGPRDWGYLALAGDVLIGSGRKPAAAYTEQSHAADAALWYDHMALVTSDFLFAADRQTGKPRWTYASGVVLNTTLTVGAGRVYFLESHSPAALANKLGRMPMETFLTGPNYLVALDPAEGKTVWKKEVDLANCRLIAYLSYADGKLVLSGNKYAQKRLWYWLYGIDAASGRIVWERSHNSGYGPGGGHGEQNRHPTIVGDVVYAYPLAYKLHTGQPLSGWRFSRGGHGCGNISASARALFWRGGNPRTWDLRPGGASEAINRVTRPGCWINMLPAGGMLLVPEASSGCTCGFPVQTSLGYVPAESNAPTAPKGTK